MDMIRINTIISISSVNVKYSEAERNTLYICDNHELFASMLDQQVAD